MNKRIQSVWRGPGAAIPRALFLGGEIGALYEFATSHGNLDGSGVVVTPGAAVQTARDRKSGRPDPLGVTSVQATAAARGLWGLTPAAGVRNLLTRTANLNLSPWTAPGVAVTLASETVNGDSFWLLEKTDTASGRSLSQTGTPVSGAGTTYSFSFFALAGSSAQLQVGIGVGTDGLNPIWGGSSVVASILSGPGTITYAAGLVSITGLSATIPTHVVVSRTYTNAGNPCRPYIYPDLSSSVTAGRSVKVAKPMFEIGSAPTAYQRVAASNLDVVEDGAFRAGFWRSDLSNDVLPFSLPSAVDGELFLIGRNGSWIEPRLASAGTAVAIGPTGTLATPGILRATGDIIAAGFIGRALSADERSRLIRAYRGHGARGALIAGADAVVNGGFADTTGWTNASTGTGTMAIAGGQCSLTGVDVSNRGRVTTAVNIPTVAGQAYLVEWTVVSGTANLQITASGATTLFDLFGAASPGQRRAAFVADSVGVSLSLNVYSAGTVVIDNICLKPLTPEALP